MRFGEAGGWHRWNVINSLNDLTNDVTNELTGKGGGGGARAKEAAAEAAIRILMRSLHRRGIRHFNWRCFQPIMGNLNGIADGILPHS